MIRLFRAVWQSETGATAIEYGLIGGLVSVAAIASLVILGGNIEQVFQIVSDAMTQATNAATAATGS